MKYNISEAFNQTTQNEYPMLKSNMNIIMFIEIKNTILGE